MALICQRRVLPRKLSELSDDDIDGISSLSVYDDGSKYLTRIDKILEDLQDFNSGFRNNTEIELDVNRKTNYRSRSDEETIKIMRQTESKIQQYRDRLIKLIHIVDRERAQIRAVIPTYQEAYDRASQTAVSLHKVCLDIGSNEGNMLISLFELQYNHSIQETFTKFSTSFGYLGYTNINSGNYAMLSSSIETASAFAGLLEIICPQKDRETQHLPCLTAQHLHIDLDMPCEINSTQPPSTALALQLSKQLAVELATVNSRLYEIYYHLCNLLEAVVESLRPYKALIHYREFTETIV